MSSSVAEPLEQALSGIAGIDQIQSRLTVGSARITIRFVLERDINEAAQDVREKVAGALGNLPPQVHPPVVAKTDPESSPIFTIAVGGPYDLRTLSEISDKSIRRALEAVNGVGEVTVAGGRAREVHVTLDIEKLSAHGLSAGQVRDGDRSRERRNPWRTYRSGRRRSDAADAGACSSASRSSAGSWSPLKAARRSAYRTSRKSAIRRKKPGRRRFSMANERSSSTSGGNPARTPSPSSRRSRRP